MLLYIRRRINKNFIGCQELHWLKFMLKGHWSQIQTIKISFTNAIQGSLGTVSKFRINRI